MDKRVGCDHVADGAEIAGFIEIQVDGRMTDGTVVSGAGTVLADLCLGCMALARDGITVHYNRDRRQGRARFTFDRRELGLRYRHSSRD